MKKRHKNRLITIGIVLVLLLAIFLKSMEMGAIPDLFNILVTLLCIAILIGAIALSGWQLLKRIYREDKWKSQFFDDEQRYTESAVIEIYIRLAGAMIRKDQDELKGKLAYLHRYFSKNFDISFDDFVSLLRIATAHPVKLPTITPWILKNLPDATHRAQLVYFLAGLSTVDGTMNPKEKAFLVELSEQIGLTKHEFASIMAMFEKYEDAYEDQFKQRSPPTRSTSSFRLEKAYEIIGISAQATDEELKKAYRILAKLHHPDRFATDGEGQQALAKERFVKMQNAYELILESRNRQ